MAKQAVAQNSYTCEGYVRRLHPAECLMKRSTLLALAAFASLAPTRFMAAQQDVLDVKAAEHIRSEYLAELGTIHLKILALAAAIPADKYSWRPGKEARSISEVLMHVATEWYYLIPLSIGDKPHEGTPRPDSENPLEKITAKSDVLEQLNKSWAYADSSLGHVPAAKLITKDGPPNMSLARAALRATGDQHEHLGQLIAYARSIGVKPPWSK